MEYSGKYLESYVHLEGICYKPYGQEVDGDNGFFICSTFPGVEQVIVEKVRKYMGTNVTEKQKKIPQVLGFHFQLQFYEEFCKVQKITIRYKKPGDEEEKELLMQSCGCSEEITNKIHNCLYNLPATHPAIDYIGVFEQDSKQDDVKSKWLLFFQISLGPYSVHGSKYKDIFRRYPKSELFVNRTILEYYTNYFQTYKVIFVYFSPKEKGIPRSLEMHASKEKVEEVYLGYIVDEEDSYITQLKKITQQIFNIIL